VNWGLISANAIVFIGEVVYTQNFAPEQTAKLFDSLGAVPYRVYGSLLGHQTYWVGTLFTSMFLHAGLTHIFGNMLFLFVFGDNVEDRLGHGRYLLFYLASGVAGGLAQVYLAMSAGYPDMLIPSVGASAAISGVLAAYLVFFPGARVLSIVGYFIMPIRALWFIGIWFLLQLLYVLGGVSSDVAYWAHVGGFLFGLVVAFALKRLEPVEY
jgi:membrane associated rhomboid family serine protease